MFLLECFVSDSDQISHGPQTKKSFSQTVTEASVAGGIAAAIEVILDHPFWSLKTRYQNNNIPQNQKFTVDPRILYRGFVPNILSMMPITALQVGTAQGLKTVLHPNEENPPSDLNMLGYNAIGGAFSSFISGPTELAMTRQTSQISFSSALTNIYREQGLKGLTVGMFGTAMRDSKFTVGFGFGAPYLKNQLTPYMPENAAKVSGGIAAGVICALASQPWDTLKTMQQAQTKVFTPMLNLAKTTYQQQGVAGFYKGSAFRMGRVAAAVMIMGEANEQVSKYLKKINNG